jgi:hypothetical protein
MSELELHVIDGDIVVTLPWTDYTVTYFKPERSPQLSQRTSRPETIHVSR